MHIHVVGDTGKGKEVQGSRCRDLLVAFTVGIMTVARPDKTARTYRGIPDSQMPPEGPSRLRIMSRWG